MGEVFLARDTRLGRQVAIKRVRADADPAAQRRISREARTVAHLGHPHIAGIFDVVDRDGQTHIVMEYVEGETLADRLGRGPLPPADALACGLQITDALAYAHQRGVIHCDIKPSNVVVTPSGGVKVLDFGIARRDEPAPGDTTLPRNVLGWPGTPAYMAPEVLQGSPPTTQSDVYSVGVLLYELLNTRKPYDAAAIRAATTPETVLSALPGLPPGLGDVVARAVSGDPATRFTSAVQLHAALEQLATRPSPRWPRGVAMAVGVLLLIGLTAALMTALNGRLGDNAPTQPSVVGTIVFNTTGDDANEYLASGLTDVLISQLSTAPGVTVVPRTAVMSYLDDTASVPRAMRELGLTHVVSGSVQRSGTRLRVTMTLMAGTGPSVLWSDVVDGDVSDFFILERQAAASTLAAMRTHGLVNGAVVSQARARPPTDSADAFEAYSYGRVMYERFDVPANLDRALTLFTRATTADPGFAAAHAAAGQTAWLKYRATRDTTWIDRALASTAEALRLNGNDPLVLYARAIIEHGTGKVDAAIATLTRLLTIQPSSDDAHRLLGRIYTERRDFDLAIGQFREALRIRPDYVLTVRALGLAYFDAGRLDEAIAAFTKMTALQPDNAAGFQMLGAAHHKAGELGRALVAYERANALAPRPAAYSNIGVIHHTRGNYSLAADAYRQAITLQPKEAITRRNLADALWMLGDRTAARVEYQRAIDLATQALEVKAPDARATALIAFCEAKLGRHADATRHIADAESQAPTDGDIVYKHAVIDTLAGRREDGLALLLKALDLGYSRASLAADRDIDPLRRLPGFPAAP